MPPVKNHCNRLCSAYATHGAVFGFEFSVSLEHGRIFRLECLDWTRKDSRDGGGRAVSWGRTVQL